MSTYAPVYRKTQNQQTLLTREQKRESQKRKREGDDDNEHDEPGEDDDDALKRSSSPDVPSPRTGTASAHPVHRTDPYYIAGLSREEQLPLYPFPHAPAKSSNIPKVSAEEALAAVKPPLYVSKADPGEPTSSVKRRHLDNITAILHQCMLKGDWKRAARAWGLLLRTEISGRGIDLRQHGRWGIGAEILMRRKEGEIDSQIADRDDDDASSKSDSVTGAAARQTEPPFSDEGFKAARDYYQRLVLQYPHVPRYPHSVNALVYYPALFNIWVFEVQDRYQRLRKTAAAKGPSSSDSTHSDDDTELSNRSDTLSTHDIDNKELEDAFPIAQRLDELLLSPPYDTSLALIRMRGMIALWLSDLYNATSRPRSSKSSDAGSPQGKDAGFGSYADQIAASRNQDRAREERERARSLFGKLKDAGVDVGSDQIPAVKGEDAMSE